MTLNEAIIIAGLKCVPTLSEGEKSQLQLVFPDLPTKKVKVKGQTEKIDMPQSMSKRSISDVTRFFTAVTDPGARLAMSEMQLPEANSVIHKALKEMGASPLDFYLESQALIDSMEAEVESVSAADPRNSIASFLAALFTAEEAVVTGAAEVRAMIQAKLNSFEDSDMVWIGEKLQEKETENGRTDSGQIRFRKPRGEAKKEESN